MKDKLCFVIGPMRDMDRLNKLAAEVIEPVVEPFGYPVETPASPQVGNIMSQVITRLDRAELVIADLTGNNPNVAYELAIRHCIGRAYIVVREEKPGSQEDKPPFDVAAYRYADIDLGNVEAARAALAPIVQDTEQAIQKQERFSNPVTDFYTAPLTEMSPASGLALGYFRNFVLPTLQKIQDKSRPVLVGEGKNKSVITDNQRQNVRLDLIIPRTLDQARHNYIGTCLVKAGLLKDAEFEKKPDETRPLTLYVWPASPVPADECRLVDVPTAMNVMEKSIQRRLGQPKPDYNDDWNFIEAQEIVRFRNALELELKDLLREQPGLKDRVDALPWPRHWPVSR
jgi:hypothetical protein